MRVRYQRLEEFAFWRSSRLHSIPFGRSLFQTVDTLGSGASEACSRVPIVGADLETGGRCGSGRRFDVSAVVERLLLCAARVGLEMGT
jgi:hypothetical protein